MLFHAFQNKKESSVIESTANWHNLKSAAPELSAHKYGSIRKFCQPGLSWKFGENQGKNNFNFQY